MNFLKYFLLKKSQKGGYLFAGDEVASGARWHANVARRTTSRVRRGVEATWQSRGWPTRSAGGVQGADMWQEATRVHAVHADARVGRHVEMGVVIWSAHGIVGPSKILGAVTRKPYTAP